ncbi:MAG TPA: LytTR family DNA-binding domain-containing protein [Pyrinomonadaceae bacterium]|jgi:hypothetical protein|nr:LytTR family DNA-binding domain-containing protein [Pyrinomonadaceae bacterium]
MNQAKPGNQFLFNSSLILLAWTLYGLFFATQSYLRMTYYGRNSGWSEWQNVLEAWLICAYAWALLTPPALWLYRRFPFTLASWYRFLVIHIPAAAVFALVHLAMYTTIANLLWPHPNGWMAGYRSILVEDFHGDFLVYFTILAINYGYRYFFKQRESKALAAAAPNTNGHTEKPVFAERLTVKQNGRIMLVDITDIDAVTSEGNYVNLHTKNKSYLLRETMNAMEQKLDPAVFVRLRRSTLVRIEQIAEFHPLFNGEFEVLLKTGAKYTSSRRYRKNLESILKP